MNTRSFVSRSGDSGIPRLAAVALMLLVALASSRPAVCDEIHYAAGNGDAKQVKALLRENSSLVSSLDKDGKTPLFFAAAKGHYEVAKLLLNHHADVDAKDRAGETPLHVAALNGQTEVAKLLLA